MLASLAGAVQATERVTLPVRDGDNVSMMLAMSGVNQGVLMELISSREIAARLEAVREGNTLELELDAGKLGARAQQKFDRLIQETWKVGFNHRPPLPPQQRLGLIKTRETGRPRLANPVIGH